MGRDNWMGTYTRIWLTLICSVFIALLLTWIVQGDSPDTGKVMNTTAYPQGKQLSENNIVDYISRLPLQLKIVKVSWQQSILSIDLLSQPGNTVESMVYHDLFELSQFGLQRVSNVNQVLVRVMEKKEIQTKHNELILAMDSRKENITDKNQKNAGLNTINMQKYLQSHYRITYTQKWKEQFID
jgi:hypothetical protein